ncbi:class I SAM-dependent methyltransferase [Anaerosporobacter faecicola]|uniref:class I SAM-dependent methyltransferase n=1 Tax=Anaerosporobacter faecicola TaxID=2718714 RepID=UPI00143C7750|nr:class I SAM-dependent methyltransferase [Anaerosporobacter faecicola]
MELRKEVTKNHFDTIAADYDNSYDGKYVRCMYDEIVRSVDALDKKDSILDLGCGNGNVASLLSRKFETSLYGVDLSENMIKAARGRQIKNAQFQVGDAECLPFEKQMFDVVICNASFHHYPKPMRVLQEIRRVLKPGGTFILGDPTAPMNWYLRILNYFLRYSNSGDYHIYGKKEIHHLLEEHGFQVKNWKMISMRAFLLCANVKPD